jgi:signal peptidase I
MGQMLDSKPMERDQIMPTEKGSRRHGAKWPGFLLRLLIIAGVTYGLFTYVVGAVFVRGDSMAPMLVNGSFVLFSRLGTGYQEGDVVVVCVDDTLSIRRILAVGGDVISFDADDGTASVNGRMESGYYTYGLTFAKMLTMWTYPINAFTCWATIASTLSIHVIMGRFRFLRFVARFYSLREAYDSGKVR